MDKSSLKVKSRIWIEDPKGTFFGEGRMNLLIAVEKYGSINKAAKSMKMSYLKAWKLIDSMNKSSDKLLVSKASGGKGGGGTILTEEGKKAIALFQQLNNNCHQFLDKEFERLMKEYQ